ncbi:unnamed protein product, partial [Ectocarpus sp. 12 AP-2014]
MLNNFVRRTKNLSPPDQTVGRGGALHPRKRSLPFRSIESRLWSSLKRSKTDRSNSYMTDFVHVKPGTHKTNIGIGRATSCTSNKHDGVAPKPMYNRCGNQHIHESADSIHSALQLTTKNTPSVGLLLKYLHTS